MDRKSALCKYINGKVNKYTRHPDRIVHFVRNGEKFKMNNIYWCEGGLWLSDIATKNVGENDLNTRMKYIMVSFDNWYRAFVQEEWQDTWAFVEQDFFITRLDWVKDSTLLVSNFCNGFDTRKEHWKLYFFRIKKC